MTVIATIAVPAADFELGRTLSDTSATRIDLEQLVPLGETALPYFWIEAEDSDAMIASLSTNDTVESASVVDELNGESLIRIDWTEAVDGLLENLTAAEGVVLDAHGTATDWTFQLRFGSYEDLSAFYRSCVEKGIGVTLDRVHNPVESDASRTRFGLTPTQQETLVAALEAGYFAVPREVTLAGLGDLLGVSDAAASERLRRGQATLVTATLLREATSPLTDDES
jgi:predicted DNA binding protein